MLHNIQKSKDLTYLQTFPSIFGDLMEITKFVI